MGGIHTDIHGRVMKSPTQPYDGLWAAGECACVSVHGANRLGSNSLSQCSVWGRMTGTAAAKKSMKLGHDRGRFTIEAEREAAALESLLDRKGDVNPYELKEEMHEVMDTHLYVYRNMKGMAYAREKLRSIYNRYGRVYVSDKGNTYNTNLRDVLELRNLIDLASIITECAIRRKESRGAHVVLEHPKRDDKRYLKHTIAQRSLRGMKVSYIPVKLGQFEPQERKY